jgi:hypothetical protein
VWLTPHLGKETTNPLYTRVGGPHGRSVWVLKISLPPGFDPRNVQPVASRYIDWAIAAHAVLACIKEMLFDFSLSKLYGIRVGPSGLAVKTVGLRPLHRWLESRVRILLRAWNFVISLCVVQVALVRPVDHLLRGDLPGVCVRVFVCKCVRSRNVKNNVS